MLPQAPMLVVRFECACTTDSPHMAASTLLLEIVISLGVLLSLV